MRTRGPWRRAVGLLLLAPLAACLAASVPFAATCDHDCGDMGGRGLFVGVLLSTPPAALGVMLLAGGARRQSALVRLAHGLVVAAVVLGTLLLAGVAVAASVGAVRRLAGEGSHGGESAAFLPVVAVSLTAMTIVALLALGAAWRSRKPD